MYIVSCRQNQTFPFLYGKDAERDHRKETVSGISGTESKAEEGGIVEPQLLCGNSWLGIRGKYPQVY